MIEQPDLQQLRLLIGVSQHLSLGAAARELGMAQPNASRALTDLERRLGLTLVRRSPAGSQLTTEGAVVVQWAREVIDAVDHLTFGVDALRSELRSELDVGASMTVAEYLMPRWLAEFRRRRPQVRVDLQVQNSYDVMAQLRDDRVALGFIESPSVARGLRSAVVGRDRLVVVVAPEHPWARRRRPLLAAELAATPLIVREPGSGTRTTLERLLTGHELAPPALELGSNAAVRISVVAGIAPAVLSVLAVAAAIDSGELRSVPVADVRLDRQLRAVWSPQRPPADNALELLQIARATHRAATQRDG